MQPKIIKALATIAAEISKAAAGVRSAVGACTERATLAPTSVAELDIGVLELAETETPLTEILEMIARSVESSVPGGLCSILLLDEEERRYLVSAAGPSLPPEYLQAVSGLEIGENVGSCGSAAFLNQTVVTENIATDVRFSEARDFVTGWGLRACWSVPIRDRRGFVQGTLAMYKRRPSKPGSEALRRLELGARLAGMVIERRRADRAPTAISERLELAETAAQFGIWELDPRRKVFTVSEGFNALFGLARKTRRVSVDDVEAMILEEDRDGFRTAVSAALGDGLFKLEFRIATSDADIRWQRIQGRFYFSEGTATSAIGTVVDVTEEKQLIARLGEARAQAEEATRLAREAEMLEADRERVLELVALNRSLQDVLDAITQAVSRHDQFAWCSIELKLPKDGSLRSPNRRSEEDVASASSFMQSMSTTTRKTYSELSAKPTKDAGAYVAAPIVLKGDRVGTMFVSNPADGAPLEAGRNLLNSWAQFAGLAIERRGVYEQLSLRAQYDELTGVLNRSSLYESIKTLIGSLSLKGGGMAILYIDLDHFKAINDRYGHAMGDEVLRTVSLRIRNRVRSTDVIGRVGGDEFVVVLNGLRTALEAVRIGKSIERIVEEPLESNNIIVNVSLSIGVAVFPEDGIEVDALLQAADTAMYVEKRARRNRVRPIEETD